MTEQIKQIKNLEELQKFYSETFGKNGTMTSRLKAMRDLSEPERAALNAEKEKLQTAFRERQSEIETETMLAALSGQRLDAAADFGQTGAAGAGRLHPMTQSLSEISAIFAVMGYGAASGPEIEDDWHNFTALNTPPHHPARDMQDTFFLDNGNVLRTQTTAVQVRELEKRGAPIRMFCAGTTFRREIDAVHFPMFHQIDWFAADRDLTLRDLIADVKTFFRMFFETNDIALRFRPSYFPFTEPSLEVDIQWDKKIGRPSKDSNDWLEMGGMGMIHPNVLANCKVDPAEYQGFAGAFGWDRLAMLKYGCNDGRKFFEGDVRWIKANGF